MPVKVREIIKIMDELAPPDTALEYDNVGLILGDENKNVGRILVALDLNDEVVGEAVDIKADFVITHHPLIFRSLKKITCGTSLGRRITRLIQNDVSVYASHTNLDIARGGTNDVLFDMLGLRDKEGLSDTNGNGAAKGEQALGRVGSLEKSVTLRSFCESVKTILGLKAISYAGNPDALVKRVGLCTGSASDLQYLKAAAERKCDVYITGDVTYHNAQAALELGLTIIDGTHFYTEIPIVPKLAEYLKNRLGEGLEIFESKAGRNILNIL